MAAVLTVARVAARLGRPPPSPAAARAWWYWAAGGKRMLQKEAGPPWWAGEKNIHRLSNFVQPLNKRPAPG